MARLGRGRPVRGVTILGPGPGYAPTPDGPIGRVVVPNRSGPIDRRRLPPRSVQVVGPQFIPDPPPVPVGRVVFARPPRARAFAKHPQGFWRRAPSPEVCRLNFVLTARAPLDFVLEPPHATLGREPLDFVIVNCRNEA